MPITFQCPNPECKRRMTVKDELAGKKGSCPVCKQRIVVPSANGVAATALKDLPPTPAKPRAVVAPPPRDAEAEAAAFFSDGPAAPATSEKPVAAPPAAKPSKPRVPVPPSKADPGAAAPVPSLPPKEQPKPDPAISVPAASSNGQEPVAALDAEAEAAAIFSDAPKEEVVLTTISFTCEFCDNPMELSLDMAGKRTPCPSCRRIIKVPDLAKPVKKDWLKDAQPEAAPEGATGSGKGATMVSEEALEAAGAIPDEPRTLGQKITRGVSYAAAAALLVWAGFGIMGWWSARKEQAALDAVLKYAKSDDAAKAVGYEGAASLYLAAGEYHRLANRPGSFENREGCAWNARSEFQQALARLGEANELSLERDAVLADLALAWIELGGDAKEVEKGLRLPWKKIHEQLQVVLAGIHDEEARLLALRNASRRLIALNQGQVAHDLSAQVFAGGTTIPRTEAVAAIGLELFSAGKKDLAGLAADKSLKAEPIVVKATPPAEGDAPMAPLAGNPKITPAVAALALVLDREADISGFDRGGEATIPNLMGQAEGHARKNDWVAARKALQELAPAGASVEDQLRVRIALGAVGGAESKEYLEESTTIVAPDASPWLWIRLIDLGTKAGMADDRLQAAANKIVDADPNLRSLRGRGQLLIFRAKLAGTKGAAENKGIETIAPSLSILLAKQALARHNAKRDSGFLKTVQTWSDPDKVFGLAGALQGLHSGDEKEKK